MQDKDNPLAQQRNKEIKTVIKTLEDLKTQFD